MSGVKGLVASFSLLVALASPALSAADLPSSKDHLLLKRFGGSEIVAYETKQFEEYELQTSLRPIRLTFQGNPSILMRVPRKACRKPRMLRADLQEESCGSCSRASSSLSP